MENRIDFFEEYPVFENLQKAKMITFPSTVYIAADSLFEYQKKKNIILSLNPKVSTAYWPILPNSYWVSPFSNTDDLKKFTEEILSTDEPLTVLVDLELPLLKNKKLYLKNFFKIKKNKKILKKFFEEASLRQIKIITAEYPPYFFGFSILYKIIGISFDPKKFKHTQCIMYYSSMIKNKIKLFFIKKEIKKISNKNPELQLGLGAIATGIFENEPRLSPSSLEKDINFMKSINVKTAIIFRLGGLDEEYLKVIKEQKINQALF